MNRKLRKSFAPLLQHGGIRRLGQRLARWILGGALLAWLPFPGYAIIDANSQANTNAPSDGAPWNSVGWVNGASGIYLGNGWVLTAAHVGAGNFDFGAGVFAYDGTSKRLTNSDGTATDLEMFHLSSLPNLPPIALATAAPLPASQVDMVGYGHIAGSAQTNIGTFTGFYWSSLQFKSWGNNRVNPGGVTTIDAGAGKVSVFGTTFDNLLQTSDEAQASTGDSGGGTFQKNGSTWQLVGMLNAIGTGDNQPGSTSVYGDVTYSADITTYRAQILAVMAGSGSTLAPTLTLSRSGSDVLICWPDSGATYNLQATSSLQPPSWTVITPPLTNTNGQFCALVPVTGNVSYFRLQK